MTMLLSVQKQHIEYENNLHFYHACHSWEAMEQGCIVWREAAEAMLRSGDGLLGREAVVTFGK